jgi:ABC-2 type transport system permease protein
VQLNVDATRMSQAFTGSGYIQQIFTGEVNEFVKRYRGTTAPPGGSGLARALQPRPRQGLVRLGGADHQPHHLLSIILTGAALIREREHGTIEHLLVMPVTPAQIMLSKVWSMALVVLIASFLSLSSSWCAASWACPSRAPLRCSSPARRSVCSPPRRWASSSPRWRATCRSSAC